jgi:hypothetical protein
MGRRRNFQQNGSTRDWINSGPCGSLNSNAIRNSDQTFPRSALRHRNQRIVGRQNYRKINSVGSLLLRHTWLSYPHVTPHFRIYKAWGHPFEIISLISQLLNSLAFLVLENSPVTHHIKDPHQDVGYYASQGGPNLYKIVYCLSCIRHEPSSYSQLHRPTPKNTSRGNPRCTVGPKTPIAGAPGRGCVTDPS